MKIDTVTLFLRIHGNYYKIESERVLALAGYNVKTKEEFWEDVTDYTKSELFDWLGYDNSK